MRTLIALIAMLLLNSQIARAEEDPNYVYRLSFAGGMTTTRFAKSEYAERMRPNRPEVVSINWRKTTEGEAADLQSEREIEAINQAIAEVLRSQPDAVLALASMRGVSQGLWAFYTSDGPRLASALAASLDGKTQVPIRPKVGKDPEWKAFKSFLSRLDQDK